MLNSIKVARFTPHVYAHYLVKLSDTKFWQIISLSPYRYAQSTISISNRIHIYSSTTLQPDPHLWERTTSELLAVLCCADCGLHPQRARDKKKSSLYLLLPLHLAMFINKETTYLLTYCKYWRILHIWQYFDVVDGTIKMTFLSTQSF